MAIADASLTSIRYAVESTWGTAPTGAYKELRMVSESLGQDKDMIQSEEIVSDRTPPDNIQTNSGASGDITSEVVGGNATDANDTWDDFFIGLLGSSAAFTGDGTASSFTTGVTVTPANLGGSNDRITLTITGNTWNAGIGAGNVVAVTGFTSVRAPLNAVYEVVSNTVGNTVLTLAKGPRVPSTPGVETPTTNTPFKVQRCGGITNGVTFKSFSVERKYSLASEYALLTGMVLSRYRFEMRPKRPMRQTWSMVGLSEASKTAQTGSSVTPAVTSRKSMSAVSDFKVFALDEDGHGFGLNEFTMDLTTGVYPQDEQAGNLGPVGIGLGTFGVTGSLGFYYTGSSIFDFASAFTPKSLFFAALNANGDVIGFDLPRVNFKNPRRATPGKDQAIKGTVDFVAAKGTDPISATSYLVRVFKH